MIPDYRVSLVGPLGEVPSASQQSLEIPLPRDESRLIFDHDGGIRCRLLHDLRGPWRLGDRRGDHRLYCIRDCHRFTLAGHSNIINDGFFSSFELRGVFRLPAVEDVGLDRLGV